MNKSWKFTDSEGVLCEAEYVEMYDLFIVWDLADVVDGIVNGAFEYDPEEVEDYLARGIWKRLS